MFYAVTTRAGTLYFSDRDEAERVDILLAAELGTTFMEEVEAVPHGFNCLPAS